VVNIIGKKIVELLDNSIDVMGAVYVAASPVMLLGGMLFMSALSTGCDKSAVDKVVLEEDVLITTSPSHVWVTFPLSSAYGIKRAVDVTVDLTVEMRQVKYTRGTLLLREGILQQQHLNADQGLLAVVNVTLPDGGKSLRVIDNDEFELLSTTWEE
jgi:hypothetical protein